VQVSVVVLNFDRPGLVVVVVLVCYVHNRGDDVGVGLHCPLDNDQIINEGTKVQSK
jgi:hypothetical protein